MWRLSSVQEELAKTQKEAHQKQQAQEVASSRDSLVIQDLQDVRGTLSATDLYGILAPHMPAHTTQ